MLPASRILIVDDDINLCRTMNMILCRKGYDVSTANDGIEAIEKVKQNNLDIVLMDIRMPKLDGVETFKRIKRIKPNIIVIMTTAYAVEDKIREAVSEGAFGVMYKPLDIDQILSIFAEFESHSENESILVIDDDDNITQLLKRILAKDGYQVETADSGVNALKKSENQHFDLFIIDIFMPDMNGFETMIALKEQFPESVYIFMTGYREKLSKLAPDSIDFNALTCLYKPFQLIEVLSAVKDALESKKNRTDS